MTKRANSGEPPLQVGVETVKPALAQEWLLRNTNNRRIRMRVVEAYARDMAAGNWRMAGEPIKFSKAGVLLDGQHRLHAVMVADVAVQLLVVRGLDDAAQTVMDTGATRSAGDALKLLGEESYYANIAAAARLAIIYEAGDVVSGNLKVTNTEIVSFVDEHPDIRRAVELASTWRNAIDVPMSVTAMAIWRLMQVDADDTVLFFSKAAEKTNLSARDPILALINRLAEIRRSSRRVSRADYLSLIFRSWNYWRTRRLVASLPVRDSGGAVAIPEPK